MKKVSYEAHLSTDEGWVALIKMLDEFCLTHSKVTHLYISSSGNLCESTVRFEDESL
jgi:hypothetical protein